MSIDLQSEAQPPRRPVSIVVVALVFIAAGLLDIWLGVAPLLNRPGHLATDDLVVLSLGIIALLGSICLLRDHNWARWLLAAWMALHVALSMMQLQALLVHAVIFGLVLAGLFHPAASAYFRQRDG